MVCIYCGNPTQVINSRLQRRANNVWRRRTCPACDSTFTTHEKADLEASMVVRYSVTDIRPLSRDILFVSLYESCKHRAQPITDADGLTQTILEHLRPDVSNSGLTRNAIIRRSLEVLKRFDAVAATVYAAYHPLTK